MQGQKLLVTGGSGFIGGEAVKLALAQGYAVCNLDLKPPPDDKSCAFWRATDIRDRLAVMAAVAEFSPDFILHLASDIDVTLSRMEDFATTIEGTRNLADAAVGAPSLKRFEHVSTQYVVTPGQTVISETTFEPYTLYGQAKAISEQIVRAAGLADFVIVRPTIIWGPNHPSFPDLIWKYMVKGSYLHPASRIPTLRGYGYVTNTAEQMLTLLRHDLSGSERRVFYLGDGVVDYDRWADAFSTGLTGKRARRIPKSLLYGLGLAGSALRALGLKAPMDLGRYFRMTTAAPVDLVPILGVAGAPRVDLAEGVKRTVEWLMRTRPDLYGSAGARKPR